MPLSHILFKKKIQKKEKKKKEEELCWGGRPGHPSIFLLVCFFGFLFFV
jgi:hypothetical protein